MDEIKRRLFGTEDEPCGDVYPPREPVVFGGGDCCCDCDVPDGDALCHHAPLLDVPS